MLKNILMRHYIFNSTLRILDVCKNCSFRHFLSGRSYQQQHNFNLFQNLSFDEIRIQKYIKMLCKQELQQKEQQKVFNNRSSFQLKLAEDLMEKLENTRKELIELSHFISDLEKQKDPLLDVAFQEKNELDKKLGFYKHKILEFILPDEAADNKSIIMELTAGVGGQEAMLFTKDMFDMYCNYALWNGWECELFKYDATDLGGLRCAHFSINGENAYKFLKYESGVHRVQRVPKTERAGRIHTSTMTVAVLPQPSKIDITIHPKDIVMEFCRSSGAGGQYVNKTETCVRLTHSPTGIVSECQMERDQHKNRELAMKALEAKLYQKELESTTQETNTIRKFQIGTAARSDKVRTYNFVQDRITDHRTSINVFNIESFFEGGESLNNLLHKLQIWNYGQLLNEILKTCE